MTRAIVGFSLLLFIIPVLLWALARLVNWPANPQRDQGALYRKRAARLHAFIEMKAPPDVVYADARLLLATQHGTAWRSILAWAISEAREAVELFLELVHVRWYAITHRCSWEQACAEITDAELKELLP